MVATIIAPGVHKYLGSTPKYRALFPPGITQLTESFSDEPEVIIPINQFNLTENDVLEVVVDVHPETDAVNVGFAISTDGGSTYPTGTIYQEFQGYEGTGVIHDFTNAGDVMSFLAFDTGSEAGSAADERIRAMFTLYDLGVDRPASMSHELPISYEDGDSNHIMANTFARQIAATKVTHLKLVASSGNVTGLLHFQKRTLTLNYTIREFIQTDSFSTSSGNFDVDITGFGLTDDDVLLANIELVPDTTNEEAFFQMGTTGPVFGLATNVINVSWELGSAAGRVFANASTTSNLISGVLSNNNRMSNTAGQQLVANVAFFDLTSSSKRARMVCRSQYDEVNADDLSPMFTVGRQNTAATVTDLRLSTFVGDATGTIHWEKWTIDA